MGTPVIQSGIPANIIIIHQTFNGAVDGHYHRYFIGEITDKQLKKITRLVNEIATANSAFKICLDDLGVFPDFSRARIIWSGSQNNPQELEKIAEDLATKLVKLGFQEEKRKFMTHITLGRIRSHLNTLLLKETMAKAKKDFFKIQEFTAEGITIYKSILGGSGSVYEVLNEAKFKTS